MTFGLAFGVLAFAGAVLLASWATAGWASSSTANALAASGIQRGREMSRCMVQIRVR
jgi:hypothetical protein